MRKDIKVITGIFFIYVFNNVLAFPQKKSNENIVNIDLVNNTLNSKKGIILQSGNLKIKSYNLKRDAKDNKLHVKGPLFLNKGGTIKLESLDGGEIDLNNETGFFNGNFGLVDISSLTGAEMPNKNIYFGGKKLEYKNQKIIIKNGWFTTDFKILDTKNPMNAGYHTLSEKLEIELDKQITIKNSNFYIKDKNILPVRFPWFRTNLRRGSKIPLFPTWGTDDYYGFNVGVGFLYGNQKDKFKGGFAPKFADTMGLLIGRWENWYETKNFGTAKLNIDDWLVWAKNKNYKEENLTDDEKISKEERKKRHKITFTHTYNGDKGNFYFNTLSGTLNSINRIDDLVRDYAKEGRFSNDIKKGKRPNLTKTINFYSLDTNLTKLGINNDISLKSKVKLTSDKKVYSLIVFDDAKDIAYGGHIDNDLFSQVELVKDNNNYRIGGYYNYLYDLDPGSTFNDIQSKAEDFGFEFLDKKTNLGFVYDEKNGDKFRQLGLWERSPSFDTFPKYQYIYGTNFKPNYTPTTIKEYDKLDKKDLKISIGEYKALAGYKITGGFDFKSEIKKLNLSNDPLRSEVIIGNERDKQYNRFENIIYSNIKENKGYAKIFDDTLEFSIAGGTSKEEIFDRDGIYINGYRKYLNKSNFYEVNIRNNELQLGKFGEIAVLAGIRYDEYKDGYNPFSNLGLGNIAIGKDSTLRTTFEVNHSVTLFNNMKNANRSVDFQLNNNIDLFYQNYSYNAGSINFGDTGKRNAKYIRTKNKDNIYQIKDTISTLIGNTETTYSLDYKIAENPATHNLTNNMINNQLMFKIDGNNSLVLNYDTNKRYTDNTINNVNYNDLTLKKYGATYFLGNHKFSYENNTINSKIWNIGDLSNGGYFVNGIKYQSPDNSNEKISLNNYSYAYTHGKSTIGISFGQGTDKRENLTLLKKELNVKNRIYNIFYSQKDDDTENHYKASYEIYNHRENGAKSTFSNGEKYNLRNSDILSFSYSYKNKKFTDKDLTKYAYSEFKKEKSSFSVEDLQKMKEILMRRQQEEVDFTLDSSIYKNFTNLGDYKKDFRFNLMFQKNEARFKRTGDYFNSLEEINASLFYAQNRIGLGYEIKENSGWNSNKEWTRLDREHKLSFVGKIGKPSEGWSLKTYIKAYENFIDKKNSIDKRKKAIDGIGIEIGKELGYYQWSVAFERRYVPCARNYEWKTSLQFTLLTFPERPLFGLGTSTKTNKHTSPKSYLLDGLKVKKVID